MKTTIKNAIAPFAVMVLGVAGAFTTTSMGDKSLANRKAYEHVSMQQPCVFRIDCSTSGSNVCKVSALTPQLWGSDTPDGTPVSSCTQILYKN